MMRIYLIGAMICSFLISANVCTVFAHDSEKPSTFEEYSLDLRNILVKHVGLIHSEILHNKELMQYLKIFNEKNRSLKEGEITKLDQEWRQADGITDFIKPYLVNAEALSLIEFEDKYFVFSEIFITDRWGLIVATTNKTTDYYQADEQWWMNAFNEGKGSSDFGPVEFDESAGVEAIAFYAPIYDPQSSEVLGVIKAILNVTMLKMKL